MKVPLNWLKDYVKLPKSLDVLTHKLTMAGHMLDKIEKKNGNTIIDLELRGNRADCYSILGIAREVSALFETPLNYPNVIKSIKTTKRLKAVSLDIQTPLVRRVMMTTIKNVKIVSSPKWLKEKLEEYGIESINNIIDLTNFVMLETGEPMHAFDLDKVGTSLHIRLAKKNEKMLTFVGKTLTLTPEELVWANKTSVLSVAGAIGEKTNSISLNTKNILLEAASYDRANIRRSIHRHNLFTEAGIRHEKDLDPNLVEFAIARFLKLIEENNWGTISTEISEYYPKKVLSQKMKLNFNRISALGGLEIDKKKVKEIFKWLEFKVLNESKEDIELLVPTFRTDVLQEEDLIEEVLRIYGYDKIPTQVLSLEVPPVITPDYINQELSLKNDLIALGFDEVISLPFVKETLLHLNKPVNEYANSNIKDIVPVKILNKPSPDTEELRMTLLPNLYDATQKVKNERGELVRFFEIGKTYAKIKRGYVEKRKLGIIVWAKNDNDYYHFKGLLDSIFEKIGLNSPKLANEDKLNNLTSSYKIISDNQMVGQGGMYKDTYYIEIDLDSILDKTAGQMAKLWPKYPPQIEDITFIIPEKTQIGDIVLEIKMIENVERVELADIFKDAYTFRIWYQSTKKTLDNKEVEKIREKLTIAVNRKFGAVVKD